MPRNRRFKPGDLVTMTDDALENYGRQYAGRPFRVVHVATKYMKAVDFFRTGQPNGYHPDYDPSSGAALYDLETSTGRDFGSSLYDYELRPYHGRAVEARTRKSEKN